MSEWADELRFALHLADVADGIAVPAFRHARVDTKADGTLVTEADTAVERALRTEIAAAYPDHAILGEEEGGTADGAPSRWILDPIDATLNYATGVPVWATLIAFEAEGDVVLGVVSAPTLGERYEAARGSGARRNGEAIRVSKTAALSEARLGYTSAANFERFGRGPGFERLLGAVKHDRGYGDFWGHMLVAAGAADVMVEPIVAPWDVAALWPIVEEAGGRLTDLDGARRYDGGTCLTTNGALHDDVLAFFSDGR